MVQFQVHQLLLAFLMIISLYGVHAGLVGKFASCQSSKLNRITLLGPKVNKIVTLFAGKPNDANLTQMMTSRTSTDVTFKQALVFIESIETSSSCHRFAAKDLLEYCGSSTRADDDDGRVEQFKTLYAARLAVCETEEAGAIPPTECARLFVTLDPRDKKSEVNQHTAEKVGNVFGLPGCLSALEARPQSWMSYSNNRQQAATICTAQGFEAERAKLIKMFKQSATVQEKMSQALEVQLEHVTSKTQFQEDFSVAVQTLMADTIGTLEDLCGFASSKFENLTRQQETRLQATNQILSHSTEAIAFQILALNQVRPP